jgi:hypothetical protein
LKERSDLDSLLCEVLSFQLYKSGKEPLDAIDPSIRIKRSVWRDDGIDVDNLERFGLGKGPPENTDLLFDTGSVEVKEGIFRKRKVHRIIMGLRSLRTVSDLLGTEKDDPVVISAVSSSDLLYPAMLSKASERLRASSSSQSIERTHRGGSLEFYPSVVFDKALSGKGSNGSSSDLLPLFSRSAPRESWLRTKAGIIKNLEGLVRSVMELPDSELDTLVSRGSIVEFARTGLKSPRLEGLLHDVSHAPSGELENPENFKKRLGRVLLGSDASGKVFQDITLPLLSRLRSCSRREAMKLEKVLGPLMDPRSTPELKDLVFNAPPYNRACIIRLMALTGDAALSETLRRIHNYSSVDEDRKEAERALRDLGMGHPVEQGSLGEISRNDK